MKKLKIANEEMVESFIRETELVEEFLDVLDYEESNSLIRMEMNVIEFPIFSKNPKVKKNQILKYYFSKDKQSYLEITPPNDESIPGEFDERVFISLLKIMKKKNGKAIFYCSLSEIADSLNIPKNSKRGVYSKIKNSIIKLSKTNYSFFNLFYLGSLNKRVDDFINTPLITSRILTFKEADDKEKDFFVDRRIKEIYRIRIADDIYGNITAKGYLVFDADILLNIKDPVVRSLYTQITKWRKNSLYLKKPLTYIAKKIPLSLKGNMLYKTVKKISDSLLELKNLNLISDFNYLKNGKTDKNEFEIFFDTEHNKNKQQLFYQDKEDFNIIHSVEERLNNICLDDDVSCNVSEIINIFGSKGDSLKTLPNIIREALKKYEFDYVKYTAEYTALNAKASILKYFKEALINNWADEYIVKKKVKDIKQKEKEKEVIEEAVVVEEKQNLIDDDFSTRELNEIYDFFEKMSSKEQEEIVEKVYIDFLNKSTGTNSPFYLKLFEKGKKSYIVNWLNENNFKEKQIEKDLKNIDEQEEMEVIKTENEKQYKSLSQFLVEVTPLVRENIPTIDMKSLKEAIELFGEYEDDYIELKYLLKNNIGSYKKF